MRTESKVIRECKILYQSRGIDYEKVFHKAKLLLKIYRTVTLTAIQKADDLYEYAQGSFGCKLSEALTYLEEFAPDRDKECFQFRVCSLFETKWLIELVDSAMLKVNDYPINGKLYYDILFKQFLGQYHYTESDMLDALNIERSVYYDRKKEAIFIFGIALWGYALPNLKNLLYDAPQSSIEFTKLFDTPTFSR